MKEQKPMIREDLPSSGHNEHTHDWQLIKEDATSMTLACRKEGCGATKSVPKPKPVTNESMHKPPVLFG